MPLVLDTGIVYAYYDRSDGWHARAKALVLEESGGLVLPAPVIPEVDHLLRHRIGLKACRVFYDGLVDGSYIVATLPSEGYARVVALNRQYDDLGFVDAAVIAIAEARRMRRIATTDRRHFNPIAAALGLEIVPDA
ncbi:MAG TPA: PIN domain-containing protein [Vicinamibacterales bacterium]|nr:PIN domain-containing protein [Vicinamibacterales bacterium]